jgi:hypothetical protein
VCRLLGGEVGKNMYKKSQEKTIKHPKPSKCPNHKMSGDIKFLPKLETSQLKNIPYKTSEATKCTKPQNVPNTKSPR